MMFNVLLDFLTIFFEFKRNKIYLLKRRPIIFIRDDESKEFLNFYFITLCEYINEKIIYKRKWYSLIKKNNFIKNLLKRWNEIILKIFRLRYYCS